MRNKSCASLFLLLSVLIFGTVSNAAPLKIAVVDIKNSAFKGTDKFYGESDAFRSNVAGLATFALGLLKDVEPQNYVQIREKAAAFLGEGASPATLTMTPEQALEFAAAQGYDYIVLGEITEAKVKTSSSKYGLTSMATNTQKKKYSIWTTMVVKTYDVNKGVVVHEDTYGGKHQMTAKKYGGFSLGSYTFAGPKNNLMPYEPKDMRYDSDPMVFGESDYGVSFARMLGQWDGELANTLHLVPIDAVMNSPDPPAKSGKKSKSKKTPKAAVAPAAVVTPPAAEEQPAETPAAAEPSGSGGLSFNQVVCTKYEDSCVSPSSKIRGGKFDEIFSDIIITDLNGDHSIAFRWFTPDGDMESSSDPSTFTFEGNDALKIKLDCSGDLAYRKTKYGKWRIETLIDDQTANTYTFELAK